MKLDWSVIGMFYDLFYSRLMEDIDGYTIGFLDGSRRLRDISIMDFGAGTGNIDFKLIDHGASKVLAVEDNPVMLRKMLKKRSRKKSYQNKLSVFEADMYSVLDTLKSHTFDVGLFRRCLYETDEQVSSLLSQSFDRLNDEGVLFIVHPEDEKQKYFDDGFQGLAPGHILRWHSSNIGQHLGLQYNRLTADKLDSICRQSCPGADIEVRSASRPAYNIATIVKC